MEVNKNKLIGIRYRLNKELDVLDAVINGREKASSQNRCNILIEHDWRIDSGDLAKELNDYFWNKYGVYRPVAVLIDK